MSEYERGFKDGYEFGTGDFDEMLAKYEPRDDTRDYDRGWKEGWLLRLQEEDADRDWFDNLMKPHRGAR